MKKQLANRVGAVAPIVMSLAALLLLLVALVTGWERGATDEGVVAHTFQLLIAAQVPFVLVFLATADWTQPKRIADWFALQILGVAAAFTPVAIFRL